MNALLVSKDTLEYLLKNRNYLRGNHCRTRTARLLHQMGLAGFDPETDICILPTRMKAQFADHPCLTFMPLTYDHAYFIRLEDVMARLRRSLFLPYEPKAIVERPHENYVF
jgi:hypothetical protein